MNKCQLQFLQTEARTPCDNILPQRTCYYYPICTYLSKIKDVLAQLRLPAFHLYKQQDAVKWQSYYCTCALFNSLIHVFLCYFVRLPVKSK